MAFCRLWARAWLRRREATPNHLYKASECLLHSSVARERDTCREFLIVMRGNGKYKRSESQGAYERRFVCEDSGKLDGNGDDDDCER